MTHEQRLIIKAAEKMEKIEKAARMLHADAKKAILHRDILASCLKAIQAALIMGNRPEDKGLVEMIDEAFEATGIKEVKELNEVGL